MNFNPKEFEFEWEFNARSACTAIFRARTYDCNYIIQKKGEKEETEKQKRRKEKDRTIQKERNKEEETKRNGQG